MDLKKQSVRQNIEKAKEFLQITLDDDYIIKDNKPDALKIICCQGSAEIEDRRISGESVWITGKLVFSVLYRCDDSNRKPEALKAAIPFQEKVYVAGIEESDRINICCKVEDLSVGLINSRKMSVRALLNIEVIVDRIEEIEMASQVSEKSLEVEELIEEKDMLCLTMAKKDVLRIRKELQLPKSKPNILNIIYDYGDLRNIDYEEKEDKLSVTGELHIFILYESEEGECEWYETVTDFSGNISLDESERPVWWVKLEPTQIQLWAETDFDGEQRQIGMELVFDVSIKCWKEQQIAILKDVYSLNENIEPVYRKEKTWQLLMKNFAKCSVSEQIKMTAGEEKIMQICSSKSQVMIERMTPVERGLEVEGVLSVETLYITSDDGFPMVHRTDQLPFTQLIEAPGLMKECSYDVTSSVETLQVNLLDNTEFEIKATINTMLFALKSEEIFVIDGINVCEANESEDDLPGMTGYMVTEKERLWDIAKQYKTTVKNIMEINELESDEVLPGDKIMIVKSPIRC